MAHVYGPRMCLWNQLICEYLFWIPEAPPPTPFHLAHLPALAYLIFCLLSNCVCVCLSTNANPWAIDKRVKYLIASRETNRMGIEMPSGKNEKLYSRSQTIRNGIQVQLTWLFVSLSPGGGGGAGGWRCWWCGWANILFHLLLLLFLPRAAPYSSSGSPSVLLLFL